MASYAPLFAHVDAWQWTPDLIWFNNLKSFGTANYYVQKLFSTTGELMS
jgi:alpha-N-arabinofuranosidase